MKNKLIISYDDLWEGNDHWEEFEKFAQEFPDLKITFFVITGNCSEEFLKKIKRPWSQLVFHSWEHSGAWQHWTVEETKEWLLKFQEYGFEKGFKAPAYKWSDNHFKACDELDFWTCSSPTVPVRNKKYWYTYPKDGEVMTYDDYYEYYDHLQNKNFSECLDKLKKFCTEIKPEFKFISEVVKTQ
ncbi:MAG: hypothetical protein KJI72_04170 [Patescibacteria group bacterium]|nr:hypothetical protein [Patescibacteria group bacterium]MCP6727504.1 hypothetical protein [Patescibacteria group bacterium]